MGAPYHAYTKSMATRFNYYANWMPGVPRQIGDFGIFENKYSFRSMGNLKDLGLEFEVNEDPTPDTITHQSDSGVEVSTHLGGRATAPGADVGARVGYKFTSKGAFVFKANEVRFNSIKNLPQIGFKIEDLVRQGRWKVQWKLITELAVAQEASILVSSSKNSEVEISAEGDVAAEIDIADASVGLRVVRQKDMSTAIVGGGPLHPLFRLHGFRKKGLFGSGGEFGPFAVLGAEVEENPEQYEFSLLSPLEAFADEDEE